MVQIERRTSTKSRLAKRGLRGASLAQLEKNLAEAFAILDTMGISKEVRHTVVFIQLLRVDGLLTKSCESLMGSR